jgi:hypothetical protein
MFKNTQKVNNHKNFIDDLVLLVMKELLPLIMVENIWIEVICFEKGIHTWYFHHTDLVTWAFVVHFLSKTHPINGKYDLKISHYHNSTIYSTFYSNTKTKNHDKYHLLKQIDEVAC